jgi:hypothetical protein
MRSMNIRSAVLGLATIFMFATSAGAELLRVEIKTLGMD